jgi:hypothetical protein
MTSVTTLLNSIKTDLLSRRMLPLVILLGIVLAGAVGYAAIGGGSSSSTPVASTGAAEAPPTVPGPAVSQAAPSSSDAVDETTSGAGAHGSSSRDPFKPLPGSSGEQSAKSQSAGKNGSSSSSSSSTKASSGSSSGASSRATTQPAPSTSSVPKPKPKSKAPVYRTTVLMGVAPTATQPASPQTYKDLKRLQPLPSAQDPRIAFMGVSSSGKGAIFSLISEAILKGPAACTPSASQCEAIDLGVGATEELEYIEADGQPVTYQLQVLSIVKSQQSATSARKANKATSAAGRQLIDSGQLVTLRHMRYSPSAGVLVLLDGHGAFSAKAHAAHHRAR